MEIKIMIVDDEVLERKALSMIFREEKLPFEIIGEAKNGLEAVDIFTRDCPDIVLMDIRMPGLSGLEVTRKLRECCPAAKVVILTAYNQFEFAQEAVKLGVSDFIVKPYLPQDLLIVLEKLSQELNREREKMEQERLLKMKLGKALPYILMSLGQDLLSGNCPDDEDIRARAEFLGVRDLPSQVLLADIDRFSAITLNQSEAEKQFLKNQVYQTIKEVAEQTSSLVFPFGRDQSVILFNPGDDPAGSVTSVSAELSEKIRAAVEKKTPVTVTVGIGRRYDPPMLHRSYEEACEAQQLGSFFLGTNRVINIEQLDILKENWGNSYPLETEKLLIEKVKIGEREEALKVANQLIDKLLLQKNKQSLEMAKSRLVELITLLSRAIIENNNFNELAGMNVAYLRKLVRCADIDNLYAWMREVIGEYIEYGCKNYAGKTSASILMAVEYIRQNYQKDLTLYEMAQVIFFNPHYFSRIFKQETGRTFMEYLTAVRIERAKKLLLSSNLSISKVAKKVGYHDANYFSRVFSKKEGLSPSKYRQQEQWARWQEKRDLIAE
ncbi:MAG: response regulator transcription factor [Desulfocucumaceae bacterium]